MEKIERGLERTKLMEPWKMLKNLKITDETPKTFMIGNIQISGIAQSPMSIHSEAHLQKKRERKARTKRVAKQQDGKLIEIEENLGGHQKD